MDVLAGEIEAEMVRQWGVLSKRGLARKVGMTHETLRSRLNRSTQFGSLEIFRISRLLGVGERVIIDRATAEFERRYALVEHQDDVS